MKVLNFNPRKALDKIKPYVPGKPINEVKRELGLTEVIKLASNENPYGPSPKAKEAMVKTISNVQLYPDGRAYELKEALAKFYNLKMNQIVVGNGSDEIIKLLSEAFLETGDNIVQAEPTFSEYEFGALLMGAEVKKVPLKDYTHDLEGLWQAIDKKTKLVYICNPNNPTGTIIDEKTLLEFLDKLPEGVIAVLDEAYAEYVTSEAYPDSIKLIDRYPVLILRTFSKIYALAGLRVGYGLGTEKLISLLEKAREPFNVNLLGQVAALASLQDTKYKENSKQKNKQARELFYLECEKRKINYVKSETNFVLMGVENADSAFKGLLQRGVIVRSGSVFGLPHHLRVSLGTSNEMEKFWHAFDEMEVK